MMPSLLAANVPHIPLQNYASVPSMDEISRQLAISDSIRRMSRSSHGQRTPGAMRIVKPSSANNSPQAMAARRRTMMNDSNLARRRQQALDQAILLQMHDNTINHEDPVKRTSRPVSWHPTSHLQQPHMHIPIPQPDFSQYVVPAPMPYHHSDMYSGYQNFPPTPAAYSGQTSPLSTFSPLCLPYATASQPQATPAYIDHDAWNPAPQFTANSYTTNESPDTTEAFPQFINQASYNWDEFPTQGYNNVCTAPPTPDEFQPVQQPQPAVPPEEAIPYQPLEEPEEEGEILVGMGLYDPPNKAETDPGLDNYRTTTSQLLGTTYRRGQGWKLEEAWEPPATDDEDGKDEDAEGEEQEQEQDEKDKDAESATATAEQPSWI